jgi:hypothetical protein
MKSFIVSDAPFPVRVGTASLSCRLQFEAAFYSARTASILASKLSLFAQLQGILCRLLLPSRKPLQTGG